MGSKKNTNAVMAAGNAIVNAVADAVSVPVTVASGEKPTNTGLKSSRAKKGENPTYACGNCNCMRYSPCGCMRKGDTVAAAA